MVGAGAFASFCVRADCSSLLSASASYQLTFGSNQTAQSLVYGGSLVHRVSNHVKLLGELTALAGRTSSDDFDNAPVVLVGYGVRFYASSLAGDIGFIKPVGDGATDEFLLGLPFVNVSYRWD
jgi:hypothetical protein